MVPAVSGISAIKQANAERSGQNGKDGINECAQPGHCSVSGGGGGQGNGHNKCKDIRFYSIIDSTASYVRTQFSNVNIRLLNIGQMALIFGQITWTGSD